jgi:hypothetical protein
MLLHLLFRELFSLLSRKCFYSLALGLMQGFFLDGLLLMQLLLHLIISTYYKISNQHPILQSLKNSRAPSKHNILIGNNRYSNLIIIDLELCNCPNLSTLKKTLSSATTASGMSLSKGNHHPLPQRSEVFPPIFTQTLLANPKLQANS